MPTARPDERLSHAELESASALPSILGSYPQDQAFSPGKTRSQSLSTILTVMVKFVPLGFRARERQPDEIWNILRDAASPAVG